MDAAGAQPIARRGGIRCWGRGDRLFRAFTLILALALPPLLAPVGDVHRLSAGMFAIGYALSCAVPLAGGALWDLTGIPATAFLAAALSLRPWPGGGKRKAGTHRGDGSRPEFILGPAEGPG